MAALEERHGATDYDRNPFETDKKRDRSYQPSEKAASSSAPSLTSIQTDSNKRNNEIEWHYLTFDTDLPQPTMDSSAAANGTFPPEPPDLSPYINPFEWSPLRKWMLTWLACACTAVTAYGGACYASGVDQIVEEFHISRVVAYLGISVFPWGFAIAPMVLAPFSELNGRRPVFLIAGLLYVVVSLCSGLTHLWSGMIISRFLAGCSSSTFSIMVGGVVADIFEAKDRNTPMALFTGASFFGSGLGPLVSGFIGQNLNWRWIFYVHTIMTGVLVLILPVLFKETRGPILLSRKAKALNRWYEERESYGYYGFEMKLDNGPKTVSQRIRWKVRADEARASIPQMIRTSLYRPIYLLVTEPVVFFFSLWITFAWSILYCCFSAVFFMFTTVYHFDLEQGGATFAAIAIAGIISTLICAGQENLARRLGKLDSSPEGRLYYACYESALLPIGLFWFGWTSNSSIHWIVPALGLGCATIGMFSVYLAVFNYLADVYHTYASSAIAAQSFCRNVVAGAFPLFTEQMFRTLGFGGGGSLLGGIAALLTLVPWVLWFWGTRIRARSKIASELLPESK